MNPPGIEVLPKAKRSVTRPATTKNPRTLRSGDFYFVSLAEVALQQALEGLAMAGLVAGHLMHSVVDGVQAQLLGLLGQL